MQLDGTWAVDKDRTEAWLSTLSSVWNFVYSDEVKRHPYLLLSRKSRIDSHRGNITFSTIASAFVNLGSFALRFLLLTFCLLPFTLNLLPLSSYLSPCLFVCLAFAFHFAIPDSRCAMPLALFAFDLDSLSTESSKYGKIVFLVSK